MTKALQEALSTLLVEGKVTFFAQIMSNPEKSALKELQSLPVKTVYCHISSISSKIIVVLPEYEDDYDDDFKLTGTYWSDGICQYKVVSGDSGGWNCMNVEDDMYYYRTWEILEDRQITDPGTIAEIELRLMK
jgi:hypothetical protein